jgi:hypothetical protein
LIGNVGGVLLLPLLPPQLFHSCSLGYSSVDEVTPATVLPVTIADGQQHVFPEGDVCLVVAFAVVIVKFTICSMLHYAMPPKLHWRQVVVFHCSRSSSQYSGQF